MYHKISSMDCENAHFEEKLQEPAGPAWPVEEAVESVRCVKLGELFEPKPSVRGMCTCFFFSTFSFFTLNTGHGQNWVMSWSLASLNGF